MQVVVKINENDIIHIHIGDSALVEVDAYENQKFVGHVTEIAYSAAQATTTTDQITAFEVKVEIDSASYVHKPELMRGLKHNQSPFRPGMSAQVEIFTEQENKAASVPIQAVTVRKLDPESDEEAKEVVFILQNKTTAVMRQVTTGISDSKYIVVKDGLKDGEEIITGPYRMLSKDLTDGMKVKVVSDPRQVKKIQNQEAKEKKEAEEQ
jgi:HlyD family secretion protein